jgi:hypothetical protein
VLAEIGCISESNGSFRCDWLDELPTGEPIARFQNRALEEIIDANVRTDTGFLFHNKLPAYGFLHFDGETLPASSQRLIDKRVEVKRALPTKQAIAREAFGTALHTLQDFYAHSTWVELHGDAHLEQLGEKRLPRVTAAQVCSDELGQAPVEPGHLTTGYFELFSDCLFDPLPDWRPERGRCAHGLNFCPGINKDEPHSNVSDPLFESARAGAFESTGEYAKLVLNEQENVGSACRLMGATGRPCPCDPVENPPYDSGWFDMGEASCWGDFCTLPDDEDSFPTHESAPMKGPLLQLPVEGLATIDFEMTFSGEPETNTVVHYYYGSEPRQHIFNYSFDNPPVFVPHGSITLCGCGGDCSPVTVNHQLSFVVGHRTLIPLFAGLVESYCFLCGEDGCSTPTTTASVRARVSVDVCYE